VEDGRHVYFPERRDLWDARDLLREWLREDDTDFDGCGGLGACSDFGVTDLGPPSDSWKIALRMQTTGGKPSSSLCQDLPSSREAYSWPLSVPK
jgi:hypothetical protein